VAEPETLWEHANATFVLSVFGTRLSILCLLLGCYHIIIILFFYGCVRFCVCVCVCVRAMCVCVCMYACSLV